MSSKTRKKGFTLLEVIIVMVVIGILSTLAYSGLTGVIQTNRAKEAARVMTTFAERSITEGKTRKESVKIKLNANKIEATIGSAAQSELLPNGFSVPSTLGTLPSECGGAANINKEIEAKVSIGFSGISGPSCFMACNASGYCGATVKIKTENSFKASIRKGTSATFEEAL